jgi:aerobic carbon-monoxide dehydrogenase medium subunit
MYPRPFDYARPATVAEAIEALSGPEEEEALVIAGGQSLVPMMSLGLAQPDLLVDIGSLPLAGAERSNGSCVLGALTRHRELERSAELAEILPLAAEAAHHIGNPRVRNRGTLGGSLSHADPASELGAVALVHGGRAVLTGREGERAVPFDDFFRGYYETAIGPGELLTRVELEVPPSGSGHGFFEVANRADDFATAAAGAIVTMEEGEHTCAGARIAVAGATDRPVRIPEGEDLCRGEMIGEGLLDRIQQVVSEEIEYKEDPFVSASYRARAAGVCVRRALAAAWQRARGERP